MPEFPGDSGLPTAGAESALPWLVVVDPPVYLPEPPVEDWPGGDAGFFDGGAEPVCPGFVPEASWALAWPLTDASG